MYNKVMIAFNLLKLYCFYAFIMTAVKGMYGYYFTEEKITITAVYLIFLPIKMC